MAAQLGDLAESLIKRGAGVKDAGVLVPGHGGVPAPVGGLAELPDAPGSSAPNYLALAGLAAAALAALSAVAWYARRRWLG